MMHNSEQVRNLTQWREAIGDDAEKLWQALDINESPTAMAPVARPKLWPAFGKIAAALSCVGLAVVLQWQSSQETQALRTENLQLRLLSQDVMLQLDALNQLQHLSSDTTLSVAPQLLRMLATSEDPNVQLSALEALVRSQIIRSAADLPTFASEQGQARFITATYQQLYGN